MVKAVGVTEPGGPDALTELDLPAEPLGAGQVRIAVSAAAVSPTDTLVRSRPRQNDEDTVRVPGMDVAGRITETASDVDAFAVGDEVIAIVLPAGAHGGYRADVVVPAASVAAVPAGIPTAAAATIPMNGLTALLALDKLDLPAGSTLGVTGAAGTVGGYVIQLASQAGLTVVAEAGEKDEAFVRSCGAAEIVPRTHDFPAEVRKLHPDGVDAVVDCAVLDAAVLPAVRDGGTVITVRGYAGEGDDSGGVSRVRVVPVFVRDYGREPEKLARLAGLAADGLLTLRVAGELPAAQAAEAHRALEAGGTRGRYVLRFG